MNQYLPAPSFPSRHLDSPILDIPLKRFSLVQKTLAAVSTAYTGASRWSEVRDIGSTASDQRENQLVADVARMAERLLKMATADFTIVTPEDYPGFFSAVSLDQDGTDAVLGYAEAAVRPIIEAHQRSLAELADVDCVPLLGCHHSPHAREEYAKEELWAKVVEEYVCAKASGERDPVEVRHSSVTGVVSRLICVLSFPCYPRQAFVFTYDQVLMMRDVHMMRRNALLAVRTLYPFDDALEKACLASFHWQERCIESFGNPGYEIAKSVEALAKAYLPRLAHDILSGPGDTFDAMMEKVADKERALRGLTAEQWPVGVTLAAEYKRNVLDLLDEPYQVAEVFGLQKFSGHPLIDPYLTSSKAKLVAQAKDTTLPADALIHRATFMDMFTKEFIKKNRRWPRLNFTGERTALQSLHDRKVLSLKRADYSLSDWDFVHFGKELDFDKYGNYLDLVDDKAISLLLSEKHLTWDSGDPTTNKRLLLELLNRETFDTAELLAIIEEDRVPIEWLICSLYPKEREFKLAARAFTMMVLEMRTLFAMHEANLSAQVLKYFPTITMTDDKISVHRRFLEMTRTMGTEQVLRLMLELDLSSWNLMWRCLVTEGVGSEINNLFGLRALYNTVHRFFKKCCIMMRVAGCRPDSVEALWPPASDLIHYQHAGGLEGIAQKLWSICTVAMIEMALAGMPLSYTITDQGDNIVLTLAVGRDWSTDARSQLVALSEEVLHRCSDAARRVHQELKPEECLVSTTTLTYSKVVYVSGVDLPTSIKALSRVIPSSAVDFPAYSSYLASVFSGCYAAAEAAKRPDRCYWLAVTLGSLFICTAAAHGGIYRRAWSARPYLSSPHHIRMQLLMPSELGGFPIIGPYSFLYKGGGDPTSKSIASLKMLQHFLPEVRMIIGMMQSDALYDPKASVRSLIQDPFGLPISKPPNPADSVGGDTLEIVEGMTVNKEIKEVLDYGSTAYSKELIAVLATMHPFNPVIAHDLYGASVMGSVEAIKKFTLKTRTVQAFARLDPESEIVSRMVEAGVQEVDAVTRRIRSCDALTGLISSVYTEVSIARERWAVSGVVPSGVTTHLPIDFRVEWTSDRTVIGISAEYSTRGRNAEYSRGGNNAFLGSRTAQKTSDHGYKIIGRGYAETAMTTLQNFWSWAEHSPEVVELVDHISRTRSGITFSDFSSVVAGQYGGNASHRYAGHIADGGASLLGQSAFAHFVTLDSDHAGFLSASTDDYAVMFQEHLLYLTALCASRWSWTPSASYGRGVLRIGEHELPVLDDHKVSVTRMLAAVEVPEQNKLLCNPDLALRRVGGPEAGSRIKLRVLPTGDTRFSALVSLFLRAIGGRSSLPGVADRIVSSVSIALGIVEIRGIGVATYLEAAACALLDTVFGLVSSSSESLRANKNVNYLVQSYGALLVGPLLSHVGHPDLADDDVVLRLNLGVSPVYDRRFSARRALLSELASTTDRLYSDPASVYYSYPIIVFGSDTGEATLAAVIRMIRRGSSRSFVSGLLSHDEAQFVIGSPIRRLSDKHLSTEKEKLDALYLILTTYSVYRRGNVPLSDEAKKISLGICTFAAESSIHATLESADAMVRLYRQTPAPRVVRRRQRHYQTHVLSQFSVNECSALSPKVIITPTQRAMFRLRTSLGRAVSWGSGAMASWGKVQSLFTGEDVLIVGSGLGACAAAAWLGGARSIRGHDLRDDFPEGIPLGQYVPPLVRAYGGASIFQQTEDTLATSGDWFDPFVSARLCSLQNMPFVIVVDISSERGFSYEAVVPLFRNRFPHLAVVRIQADPREHEIVLGMICDGGSLKGVWEMDNVETMHERIYAFTVARSPSPFRVRPMQAMLFSTPGSFTERDTVIPMLAYLLAPLGGVTGTTVGRACRSGLATFHGLYHDHESRHLYNEWTECLEAAVACEMIIHATPANYELLVGEIMDQGYYRLKTLPDAWVLAGDSLVYALTSQIARLIGHKLRRIRNHKGRAYPLRTAA